MKTTALIVGLCMLAAPSRAFAQVSAEPFFRAGTWMVTAEVGGAAFSDLERTQANAIVDGLAAGDFNRRVSARTAASVGGWVSYWIGNGWGLRAGLSYVPTSFTVWHDESGGIDLGANGAEASYASLDIWMANAAAVFRFPHSFGRVAPYGIAGAGMIRYRASGDAEVPPEAREEFADGEWQSAAGLFGIGAAIPLQRGNLLMTFELTNHLSRSPLSGGSTGEVFEVNGTLMQIDDADGSHENEVGLTSHVRLAFGLTLPIR